MVLDLTTRSYVPGEDETNAPCLLEREVSGDSSLAHWLIKGSPQLHEEARGPYPTISGFIPALSRVPGLKIGFQNWVAKLAVVSRDLGQLESIFLKVYRNSRLKGETEML